MLVEDHFLRSLAELSESFSIHCDGWLKQMLLSRAEIIICMIA